MSALPTLTAVMPTLFVTTLVDLTIACANLDFQAMAKNAPVSLSLLGKSCISYWLRTTN